jgi:hypothetical protein
MFVDTRKSFSLATSTFYTFSWSSANFELWEFGKSKVKVVAAHFRKMLANDEKDEQILNNIWITDINLKSQGRSYLTYIL